jgi:hypothetical protein
VADRAPSGCELRVARSICAALSAAALLFCPTPALAQAQTVVVTIKGFPPARVVTRPSNNNHPFSSAQKGISIRAQPGWIVKAYFLEGATAASRREVDYGFRLWNLPGVSAINITRVERTGCDVNALRNVRPVSNDVNVLITSLMEYRYFAINCKVARPEAIRGYCNVLFRLPDRYSDFLDRAATSSKTCVEEIKTALEA